MKAILTLPVILLLVGCVDGMDPSTKTEDIKTRCIEGVQYVIFKEMSGNQGFGFMTVKHDRDGSVLLCN